MYFDLWTFFVDQLFGGFWLAVFGILAIIFLIMGVFGRMSKMTVLNYTLLFFMTMCIGFGVRWITILISFAIITWVYIEFKNFTGG